jgi:putative PEP-CTERM system TPR-repeat lipoprotein
MLISRLITFLSCLTLVLLLAGCAEDDKLSAAEHSTRAEQLLSEGDLNAAIIEIKNALRDDPKNPDVRWLAGQIYLANGQSAAAEQQFTTALELGLSRADGDLLLVRSWIAQGELEKALEHFEANDLNSLTDEGKVLFAELLLKMGEIVRAEEVFLPLTKTSSEKVAAQIGLAKIAVSRGNIDLANTYTRAALEAKPDNPFANMIAGEIAVSQERFVEAEKHFAIAAADPRAELLARLGMTRVQLANGDWSAAATALEEIALSTPDLPLVHYLLALAYYQQNNAAAAVDALETVQTFAPKHNPTLLLLGKLYLDNGQTELANNALSTLFASDPNNVAGRNLLAATRLRMNLPKEALAILGDSVSVETNDLLALITAGSALLAINDHTQAAALLEKAATLVDDPSRINSQLAKLHLAAGDVDTAVQEFRKLTQTDSSNPQHQLLLAYSLVRQGKLEQALASADQLEAQGLIALSANLKGAIALAQNQLPEARKQFERAITADASFIPPRLNLARIAQAENRFADATKTFDDVLAIDPNNLTATLGLANLEVKNDQTPAALKRLKAAAKETKNANLLLTLARLIQADGDTLAALDYAQQAQRVEPQNPAPARTIAAIQVSQGLPSEGLRTLEAIPVDRRNDSFNFNLAQLYRINNRPDRAREILTDLVERSPANLEVLVNLVSLELEGKDIEKAESLLTDYSKTEEPAMHIVTTLRGDIHRAAGRHQQAIDAYTEAFKLNPNGNLVSSLTGELIAVKQEARAQKLLTDWINEHPDDLGRILQLANLRMMSNDRDGALLLYEQVLAKQPDQPLAMNNLAWLYFEKNDPRAIELANQIAETNPERPEVLDTIGWIFVAQGDKNRGLELLTMAHEKSPESAEITYHLAVAYHRTGDSKKATQLFSSLSASHPDYINDEEVARFAEELANE